MKQEEINHILLHGGTVKQVMNKASVGTRRWGLCIILLCFIAVIFTFMRISFTQTTPMNGKIGWDKELKAIIFTSDNILTTDQAEDHSFILISEQGEETSNTPLTLIQSLSSNSKLYLKPQTDSLLFHDINSLNNIALTKESNISLLGYISIAIKGNY